MGLTDESFEYALFVKRANDKAYVMGSIFWQGEISLVGFCGKTFDGSAGVAALNESSKDHEGRY